MVDMYWVWPTGCHNNDILYSTRVSQGEGVELHSVRHLNYSYVMGRHLLSIGQWRIGYS